jgi:dienelactone hydrolase
MHEQCDRFAAAGYLTKMPDLYHGKPMIRYCLGGGFGLPLAGCGGFHAAAVGDGELPQNLDARRRR